MNRMQLTLFLQHHYKGKSLHGAVKLWMMHPQVKLKCSRFPSWHVKKNILNSYKYLVIHLTCMCAQMCACTHTHTQNKCTHEINNSNIQRFMIVFVTQICIKKVWHLNIWAGTQIQRIYHALIKSIKIIYNYPVFYVLWISDFHEYWFNCTHLAMNPHHAKHDYPKISY